MRVTSAIIVWLASVLGAAASEAHVVGVSPGCTGFHVEGGYYVTAGHCVQGLGEPHLVQDASRALIAEVVAFEDPEEGGMDFAVLYSADGMLGPGLPLDCGDVLPETGSHIHISGFPADLGYTHLHGEIISSARPALPIWEQPVLLAQVPILPGSSGSPVSNDAGEVIGIAVGGWFPTSFTAIQPIGPVCEVLDDLRRVS